MSTIRTLFRATAVVAGSSAALLLGGLMGTTHADPAPVPAPDITQQLVGTAAQAPPMLQNVPGARGGAGLRRAPPRRPCRPLPGRWGACLLLPHRWRLSRRQTRCCARFPPCADRATGRLAPLRASRPPPTSTSRRTPCSSLEI